LLKEGGKGFLKDLFQGEKKKATGQKGGGVKVSRPCKRKGEKREMSGSEGRGKNQTENYFLKREEIFLLS